MIPITDPILPGFDINNANAVSVFHSYLMLWDDHPVSKTECLYCCHCSVLRVRMYSASLPLPAGRHSLRLSCWFFWMFLIMCLLEKFPDIPQQVFNFGIITADDEVNMIRHDNPCVQVESFLFYTIAKTIKHDFFIQPSAENIYPAHIGKSNKMRSGNIAGFSNLKTCQVFF